jgi:alpha-tubulin suppressor-like RCC1 family protein
VEILSQFYYQVTRKHFLLSFKIKENGNCFSCGNNSSGQLGYKGDSTSTFNLIKSLEKVRVIQIGVGSDHCLALIGILFHLFVILFLKLKDNGNIYSWGYNYYGELGLGHTNDTFEPQIIKSDHKFISIYAGGYSSFAISGIILFFFSIFLFILDSQICFSCGDNKQGQLGIGDNNNYNTLQNISFFNGKKIKSISVGYNHTLSISGLLLK